MKLRKCICENVHILFNSVQYYVYNINKMYDRKKVANIILTFHRIFMCIEH